MVRAGLLRTITSSQQIPQVKFAKSTPLPRMKQYMSRMLTRYTGYAELINFRALRVNDLAPHSCSFAMRRALWIHLHPYQERGELENIAPDDHFPIPPSADGLVNTWITGLRQFSVQVCMYVYI